MDVGMSSPRAPGGGHTQPSTAGHSFASTSAPYLRYLAALKDDWTEARQSLEELEAVAKKVSIDWLKLLWSPISRPVIVAEVLDIRADTSGTSIKSTASLTDVQAYAVLRDRVPVDSFFESTQHCTPDVHTRIVVLTNSHDREFEALLFSHTLGFELEMRPSHIWSIVQALAEKVWDRLTEQRPYILRFLYRWLLR